MKRPAAGDPAKDLVLKAQLQLISDLAQQDRELLELIKHRRPSTPPQHHVAALNPITSGMPDSRKPKERRAHWLWHEP